MLEAGAHSATDITGFGLAGHAFEMAEGSKATIAINLSALPLLPGAQPLARRPYLTRASATNSSFVAAGLRIEGQPDPNRLEFFYDPQTSGGLLISIQADKANALVADAKNRGAQATCVIGEVLNRTDAALILRE